MSKWRKCGLSSLMIFVTIVAGSQPALSDGSNCVAVLDFVSDETEAEAWNFGLADFLETQLQARGISTYERRNIQLLISERRLASSGLVRSEDVIRNKLPWVRTLIRGNIQRVANASFSITLSLFDAVTGHEIATLSAGGAYPDELTSALGKLADTVLEKLGVTSANVSNPRVVPGFTRIPEVALLYYRGLEHCLSGRPEYGVAYFSAAARSDPSFVLAKIWKLRAFEMAGAPEYVSIARDELLKSPHTAKFNATLASKAASTKHRTVITVVSKNCTSERCRSLLMEFKQAIQSDPELELLNPDAIPALAAEGDLQLTDLFPVRPVDPSWAFTDVVIVFERTNGTTADKAEIKVTVIKALSGDVQFSHQISQDSLAIRSLCQNIQKSLIHPITPVAATSPAVTSTNDQPRYPWPIASDRQMDQLAQALYLTTRQPPVRLAFGVLAEAFRGEDVRYRIATWDRCIGTIRDDEPHAAEWLATALWGRRWGRFTADMSAAQPRWEDDFALLLRRHPESQASALIRYAVAHECMDEGRHEQALQRFVALADKPPTDLPKDALISDFMASLYYFTSVECLNLGRTNDAVRYIAQADEFGSKSERPLQAMDFLGLGYQSWGVYTLKYLGCKKRPTGEYWYGLQGDIQKLRASLKGVSLAPDESPPAMLARAQKEEGASAAEHYTKLVNDVIQDKDARPDYYRSQAGSQALIPAEKGLNSLARRARSDDQFQTVWNLADQLARGLSLSTQIEIFKQALNRRRAIELMQEQIKKDASPSDLYAHRLDLFSFGHELPCPARYFHEELDRLLKTTAPPYLPSVVSLGYGAGEAFCQVGLYDDACQVYQRLYNISSLSPQNKYSIAYHWAESEDRRGNRFKSAELLRDVVDNSHGQTWFIYSRPGSGGGDLYSAALGKLKFLRLLGELDAKEENQTFSLKFPGPGPPIAEPEATQIKQDLDDLLEGFPFRNSPNPGDDKNHAIIRKYGEKIIPAAASAIQRASPLGWDARNLSIILNEAATENYGHEILKAYSVAPPLASVAFRFDRQAATRILRRHLLVAADSGYIRPDLVDTVIKYRVQELYDLLFLYVAENRIDSDTYIACIDRAPLAAEFSADQEAKFCSAIARHIQRKIQGHDGHEMETLASIALKHGVPEGIEGLLSNEIPPKPSTLMLLRRYVDLPADDQEAAQYIKSKLGQWNWDASTRKFVAVEEGKRVGPGTK